MSDLSNFWWQSQAAAPHGIGNSLRFRGAQSLSRTMAGAGTGTETVSYWIKLGSPTDSGMVMARTINAGYSELYTGHFGSELQKKNGSNAIATKAAGLCRDPSAWYHVVITTKSTGSEIFVNGISRGTSGDAATFVVAGQPLRIGGYVSLSGYQLNGYLSELHFVDGQALSPTTFGEFNADGVWIPKKVSGVTYGTNGFYLDFSDPADIGADRSGNGNNFTATGFDFTAANGYSGSDLTPDSPTNNQLTNYNLLTAGTVTTTLDPWFWSRDTALWNAQVPQALLPKSGKWWVEFGAVWGGAASESVVIGFVKTEEAATKSVSTLPGYVTGYGWANPSAGNSLWFDHSVQTTIAPSISVAPGNKYKLGLAIDCDQATPTVQLWQNAVNDFADTAGWTKQGDATLDRTRVDAGLVLTTSIYYGNAGPRFSSTNPTTDAAGYKIFHSQDLPMHSLLALMSI